MSKTMNMAIVCGSRRALHVADADPASRYSFSRTRCGPCGRHTHKESRRYLLGISLAGAFPVATSLDLKPTPEYPPKNPLIEKLLERSRANKAKNDQERLDSYYERNYKEYFEFLEGTIKTKSDLTETEKGILNWLDKTRNKKK